MVVARVGWRGLHIHAGTHTIEKRVSTIVPRSSPARGTSKSLNVRAIHRGSYLFDLNQLLFIKCNLKYVVLSTLHSARKYLLFSTLFYLDELKKQNKNAALNDKYICMYESSLPF